MYDRVYREALGAKGLSAGTVHAYVVDTGGHVIDSLHVAEAARTERLTAMLERATVGLKSTEPGRLSSDPGPVGRRQGRGRLGRAAPDGPGARQLLGRLPVARTGSSLAPRERKGCCPAAGEAGRALGRSARTSPRRS